MIGSLYRKALKPFLFTLDAETAHEFATHTLAKAANLSLAQEALASIFVVKDRRLEVSVRSLSCPNPVGLAAGFDKGAELLDVLPSLGFGFVELGTFTPLPQEGQKRPRLFRYKRQQALVNRMGFNNPGVKVAAERLAARSPAVRVPVGANVGKGRETPIEEAMDDYLTALKHVHDAADYLVLNMSSPNTPNLRQLQQAEPLEKILRSASELVRTRAEASGAPQKPLFVKISPDNDEETLEEIARLCLDVGCGIVATNTTTEHGALPGPRQQGGLSGRPLRHKSNDVIRRLYRLTRGVVPIIGVGGIFSAADAYEKMRLGASLVQVYTGWIYQGPTLVKEINRGLLRLMEKDGVKSIKDVVGTGA
jgi:dihydroorotate dehydrogenase